MRQSYHLLLLLLIDLNRRHDLILHGVLKNNRSLRSLIGTIFLVSNLVKDNCVFGFDYLIYFDSEWRGCHSFFRSEFKILFFNVLYC